MIFSTNQRSIIGHRLRRADPELAASLVGVGKTGYAIIQLADKQPLGLIRIVLLDLDAFFVQAAVAYDGIVAGAVRGAVGIPLESGVKLGGGKTKSEKGESADAAQAAADCVCTEYSMDFWVIDHGGMDWAGFDAEQWGTIASKSRSLSKEGFKA